MNTPPTPDDDFTRDAESASDTGYPALPHSESQDWRDVAPCFTKILAEARPYAGAIRAVAEETRQGERRSQLQSVANALDANASADEIFKRGDRLSSDRVDAFRWRHLSDSPRPQADITKTLGKDIGRAFIYPLLLITVLLVFSATLSLTVLPEFRVLYDDFDLHLPPSTRLLLNITPFLMTGIVICIAIMVVWSLRRFLFSKSLRHYMAFRMPLFGRFYRYAAYGEFCHLLSIMLHSDAPFESATRVAGRATLPTAVYQNLSALTAPDRMTWDAPRRLELVMKSPFDNQHKANLLHELAADFYARASRRSRNYLQPLIVTGFGIFVGFVVVALFAPLISLVGGLAG